MLAKENAQAVIVSPSGLFIEHYRQVSELAMKFRMPSIFTTPAYAEAGGLMSYGPANPYSRVAVYVDKILKGAKPADLPVEQPTKFDLLINRKTAKALGLNIPQPLLISAAKLIE